MGGKFKKEGTYVYLWLIHVDAGQKPTQYCKAINYSSIKFFFKKSSLPKMLGKKFLQARLQQCVSQELPDVQP